MTTGNIAQQSGGVYVLPAAGKTKLTRNVRQQKKMKKEFKVIIEKEGEAFVVRCLTFPDAVARAPTSEKALEEMKKIITERSKESGETEGK